MGNGRFGAAVKRRAAWWRARRDERGAVLVEAIIVIPIMMMITLGIVEYGGAYREDATIAAASRAGARVASSLEKTEFGTCTGSSCSADSGVVTAAAVAAQLQSLGATGPQELWIFKVSPGTSGPIGSFGSCTLLRRLRVGFGHEELHHLVAPQWWIRMAGHEAERLRERAA